MKRVVVLSAGLVLTALLAFWWWPRPQVRYQGKSLEDWLGGLDAAPVEFLELDPKPNQPAVLAIRSIGTNAIPHLRAELTARDSAAKLKLAEWLKKQSVIRIEITLAEVRHRRALAACQVLGEDARELVPELSKRLLSGFDPVCESFCLAAVGPAALSALTNALASPHERVRMRAASAFRYVRYDAEPAIPRLVKCLDDAEPRVRVEAAMALGRIGRRADLVVPALVRKLEADTDPTVRGLAAHALGFLGEEARPAVPVLIKAIQSDKQSVVSWASQALTKIDPQTASSLRSK